MEINTETWEKFRVGDLFDVFCSKGYDAGKLDLKEKASLGYSYEFVGRTSDNYGVQGFSESLDTIPNEGNTISVSQIGTIVAQYRERDYYASQNMFKLVSKTNLSKEQSLFFIAVLNKLLTKYSGYTDYPTLKGLKNEHILLPEKASEPDWDFMEEYIKEIKDKYIDKIEKLNDENIKKALEVAGLTETDIDKELVLPVCDRYEEFRVGDLFDGDLGDTDIKAEDINDMGYPTITSGTYDFGVLGNTDVPAKIISKNTITIDMFGNSYYRTFDYKLVTHARVFSLIPKFNTTKNAGLYLKTSLFYLTKMFGYSNMCSYNKIKELFLNLPAIDKNTPDFDFMEVYIYIYISIFIKNKKLDNERKVELMRKAL